MVASKVSFFPNLLGENILKFVTGGGNIQWMRGVYNIGPKKLFLFLTYFVYSRYTLFLSQNLFVVSACIKMAVELSFKFIKVFRTLKLGKNYQVKV